MCTTVQEMSAINFINKILYESQKIERNLFIEELNTPLSAQVMLSGKRVGKNIKHLNSIIKRS